MAEARESRRHRVLLELGRGGMGTVYLAAARGPAGFEKLKVVKRLHSGTLDDAQFLTMFLEEARIAARLNHPNVVQTNEVGFDGRDYFIEMEYLEGQPLDGILRRAAKSGGLPTALAIWVLTQVLNGLAYAHELTDHGRPLGLVHRDVSPHNVFITYEGVVKVLDFGIAKVADSASETRTGMVKGKATYMAPEQAARGPVDARADVFAVGVMMWETLTRKRLWDGLQDGEIFQRLAAGEIPRARDVAASVDERLDEICAKALAVAQDKRWQGAAEMRTALEEWLETSGERFGQRAVGKWLSDAFAERRVATRQEVEAQLDAMRERGGDGRDVDVPTLGMSAAYRRTRTGETKPARSATPRRAADAGDDPAATRQAGPVTATPHGDAAEPTRTGSAQVTTGAPTTRTRSVARTTAVALVLLVAVAAVVAATAMVVRMRSDHTTASIPRCSRNADCKTPAEICRAADGACVALETDQCRLVLAEGADVTNDATVWLGVMLPNGPAAPKDYVSHVRACDLARREIAQIAGGLPPAAPGGPRRPLAILVCDDSLEPEAVAHHLAADLHVPAVIGFRDGQEAVDVIRNELLPSAVLAIVALNTSALITEVPEPEGAPRLVWRTTYSNAEAALPLSAIVSQVVEPRMMAAHAGPLRVAVLRQSSSTGLAFSDRLFSILRFNGKPALENGSGYREFEFGPAPAAGDGRIVEALLALAPHVILHTGSDELPDRVFAEVERRWPAHASYRPYYVAGSELGTAAVRFARSRADLRPRFLAIATVSASDANAKFVMRYNSAFPDDTRTRSAAPNTSYDAVYALAYAVVASGKAHPSGAELSGALARLTTGEPVDVGPARIFDAFRSLAGGTIDLRGTAGGLDWDPRTGEIPFEYSVLCVTSAGEAEETRDTGMTFDPRNGALAGTAVCP